MNVPAVLIVTGLSWALRGGMLPVSKLVEVALCAMLSLFFQLIC